jgi:hypothetical protein
MVWTTWRNYCSPIIAEVIERVGTEDPKALRKALLDAYPYGQRCRASYKIWRDEIQLQLSSPATSYRRPHVPAVPQEAPGQLSLLG